MKVLFIGNSHTYVNNMPAIVKDLAKEKGIEMHVTMIAHPGWHLSKHLENPEVKFNILYGDYDYVVVQEYAHPFGPIESLFESIRTINSYIKNTKSKLILFPTWAAKDKPEDQEIMSKSHIEIAKEVNAKLACVDTEWVKEDREKLYGGDGEHASLYGSTLVAKCILKAIIEMEEDN